MLVSCSGYNRFQRQKGGGEGEPQAAAEQVGEGVGWDKPYVQGFFVSVGETFSLCLISN